LILVDLLTENPLHCEFCRKEVDPERVQLTVEETDQVAAWFATASALYCLWLNSGEYEEYAKARLLDPNGQVNLDGLAVARALSSRVPTRLWFFHDTDDGEPTHCPICSNPSIPTSNVGAECVRTAGSRFDLLFEPDCGFE
jgi:hypothetical protein